MPVSEEIMIFRDDFETDKGWVISGGLWERGIPLGLGGQELQYPVPDPTDGCNSPQVLGYNLAGDYENDLPETHVTSPAIDCSDMQNVHLRFCRWLGVERPVYDEARVLISTNGSDWTILWENNATIVDLEWVSIDYDISAIADSQPEVHLRWTMGPTDGGLRYIGWNIDDVRVVSLGCRSTVCIGDRGNVLLEPDCEPFDQTVDISDLTNMIDNLFISFKPYCCLEEADIAPAIDGGEPDGIMDISDLTALIDHLFIAYPALPECP